MKLNFWKKKKKELTVQEKSENILSQIKELAERRDFTVGYFCITEDEGGSTYVNGDPRDLLMCIRSAYESNPGFKKIIDCVASGMNLDDIFSATQKKSKVIDLPDGLKGLMVSGKDLLSMNDEDIDKIIDEMTEDDD